MNAMPTTTPMEDARNALSALSLRDLLTIRDLTVGAVVGLSEPAPLTRASAAPAVTTATPKAPAKKKTAKNGVRGRTPSKNAMATEQLDEVVLKAIPATKWTTMKEIRKAKALKDIDSQRIRRSIVRLTEAGLVLGKGNTQTRTYKRKNK